jgi:PAS domain S-box-containing protein
MWIIVRKMLTGIVTVALAYLFLGRLSLLLAIPPGYAMAIYPPAGLALAAVLIGGYRLAPGVALGSLMLNLWITWETQQALSSTAWLLASTIALGAMLQASCGAYLVRRRLSYPIALNRQSEIVQFMLLAAPLACVINASVGIIALVAVGFMPVAAIFGNWLTWWGGDSLGVLVITPICLVLFGEPRALWKQRRYSVMLPQLLTLLLMIISFLFVRDWEQGRLAFEFNTRVQSLSTTFQSHLQSHVGAQRQVGTVFTSFPNLSREQFSKISAPLFTEHNELFAVQWAPRISDKERKVFEALLKEKQVARQNDMGIFEVDEGKNRRAAKTADLYFPLHYVVPEVENDDAFGFNMLSIPNRRRSVEQAIFTQQTIASEPLFLIKETQAKLSTLLITAVYNTEQHRASNPGNAENRSHSMTAVAGIIIGILRPGDVLNNLLNDTDKQEIKLRLADTSISATNSLLFFDNIEKTKAAFNFEQRIEFAGRSWILKAQPSDSYLANHTPWAAWSTLLGGMFFSALVGMYFLMISGRAFQIETLVLERTKQLRESEQKRLAILEHAADGILTVNSAGMICSCNRVAEISLGSTIQGLEGSSLENFFVDDHANGIALSKIIASTKNNAHALMEVQRIRPDGSHLALELAIATIQDQDEVLYIVVLHDLTERKRVDKIKGEFVSTVSHELRTPLTSIRGSLGLLVGGAMGDVPEKAMHLIKLANNNAERLHKLINDILDFEKLEYGGMLFKFSTHNIVEQVRRSQEYNIGYASNFGVRLELIGGQQENIYVKIDENRLMQILSNLISNAIKFSHQNSTVELEIEARGKQVRIIVRDHGIGIEQAFGEHIFKKFTQADASGTRKYAGTGLGLSLAKTMIEKMGGNIGFTSVVGEGSSFFIDLPIVEVEKSV